MFWLYFVVQKFVRNKRNCNILLVTFSRTTRQMRTQQSSSLRRRVVVLLLGRTGRRSATRSCAAINWWLWSSSGGACRTKWRSSSTKLAALNVSHFRANLFTWPSFYIEVLAGLWMFVLLFSFFFIQFLSLIFSYFDTVFVPYFQLFWYSFFSLIFSYFDIILSLDCWKRIWN